MENPHNNKIVLLGKEHVGKSTLVRRIIYNEFSSKRESTIGVAFSSYNYLDDKDVVPLHFWDTAGHERFNSFLPLYIKGAFMVLICFENYEDIETIKTYTSDVKNVEDCYIIFVGTKCDKKPLDIENMYPELYTYTGYNNIPLFITSSKTGKNVQELVKKIVSFAKESKVQENSIVILNSSSQNSRWCCF